MKTIIILTAVSILFQGCAPMTVQQRQGWADALLRARTITTAIAPIALAAGAYADIENAQSLRRISKR